MQEPVEYVVCDPKAVDPIILLTTADRAEAEDLVRSINGTNAVCGLSGRVAAIPRTKSVLDKGVEHG